MHQREDETGARAAILARLWGAYAREPLAGVTARHTERGRLVLDLERGGTARGPAVAAEPFAHVSGGLVIDVDGRSIRDAGMLLEVITPPSAARTRLRAELDNSAENLARARRAPAGSPDGTLPGYEQSVVDGHPLHPLCRTRIGMSPDEVGRYAPEFRPVIELTVVDVPPERWLSTGTGLPPRLPMHPWQREHVLDTYPGLRPTGDVIRARPLMSLRTVAPLDQPGWHLKTAVDVQMTSAVRIVSPAAIRNGPVVSALLANLAAGEPLDIFTEPAAGAVLVDGEPARSLAYVRRRVPALRDGEVMIPFGALSARNGPGRAILAGDPIGFFERTISVALPPLLRILARGVALEAHGQNLLIVLDRAGQPVRIAYRDMGGVRISPRRLAEAGIAVPALAGDLATDDPDALRTKFAAAFLATVAAELIGTLGQEHGVDPDRLWRIVADTLQTVARPDDADVMLGPTLPVKAMTAMRLADAPLEDIWTGMANPMAGL
jgi:staphyloferrin A synthase